MEMLTPAFWSALLSVILINIVLSGDNAVVIAMACRSLTPAAQKKGMLFGGLSAAVLLVILTIFAMKLLSLPFLKLFGSALLLWIGIKLFMEEEEGEEVAAHETLGAAVKTIVVANLVMSTDNVLAVAAAAHGNAVLIAISLMVSVPLVIFGSAIIMKLMEKFPFVIIIGAALIGRVAGEMLVAESFVNRWIEANASPAVYAHIDVIASIIGAIVVVVVGKILALRAIKAAGIPETADE
jgi:YjbE family integral membrane protein